jgi:hypothetical protein
VGTGPGDTASTTLLPEFLSRWYTGQAQFTPTPPAAWRAVGCAPIAPAPCQRNGYFQTRRHDVGRRAKTMQRVLERLPDAAWPGLQAARRAVALVRGRRVGPLGETIPPEVDVDAAQLAAHRSALGQVAEWYRPSWPAMPVFALPSFAHGYLRVNVVGRERDGVVDVADYDDVLDALTAELRCCASPRTGRPVVRDVVRTRERSLASVLDSAGPYADAVVVWEDCVDAFHHPAFGLIGPFPLQRVAGHTPNGFAHVHAPGVANGDAGRRAAADVPRMIQALLAASPADELVPLA